MMARQATAILSLLIFGAGLTHAQGAGPAEIPPESFKGRQYIDSKGCIYLRETADGAVNWVPRTVADGEVMCGFAPSLPVPKVTEAPKPEPVPEPKPAAPVEVAKPETADPKPVEPTKVEPPKPVIAEETKPETKPAQAAEAAAPMANPSEEEAKKVIAAATMLQSVLTEPDAVDWSKGDYVQIAAFARPDNTLKTKARMEEIGLSIAVEKVKSKGKTLEVVLVGPFSDSDSLKSALKAVRKAGYRDAFPRKK